MLKRLNLEAPVVQAGMGGGLSRHELAAAVSEAGGLGTIAVGGAGAIRHELAAARRLTSRPIAVNLLLPFARRDWFEAAAEADVVVTFWGKPRRRTPGVWLHQCGSVAEVQAAHAAGADALIVQGVEAGGHVRGKMPAPELFERAAASLPSGYPLMLAGGIATREDVNRALDAGAVAVVAGTPVPALGGEPRPPRVPRSAARRQAHAPHRALRRRLAGAAPRHRQRRHRTLAQRGPSRSAFEPTREPAAGAGGPLRPG